MVTSLIYKLGEHGMQLNSTIGARLSSHAVAPRKPNLEKLACVTRASLRSVVPRKSRPRLERPEGNEEKEQTKLHRTTVGITYIKRP